jgi:superfamily II DNA or RNA helicase
MSAPSLTEQPATPPAFAVGSLVSARGRDWVVLPGSDADLLVLRPLGGGEDDVVGVLPDVEEVTSATFAPPSPADLGDDRSARLLRDALRIGFRSSGGPFRCLAGLNVTPRPYQLVPLLLALRHETVRLLIADDVGIGKTIEAGLIAAELLAQGSARGLTVLCPPSLAEQWRAELSEKFGLDAALVLPGTVTRLQRDLATDESIFDRYPVTVVSMDYMKAESRRHDFLRAAPDLVIIDEAHGVAADDSGRSGSGRTQRYRLAQDLAGDRDRHLLLVTATPHSGNDAAFRNLIGLLDPALRTTNLAAEDGRRLLADHLIQRRRADIRSYLGQNTQFPKDRETEERAYTLTPPHRDLFDDVLAYVRGQVQDRSGTRLNQRVRWWSALSLLRSMASSPAAAAATLETRAAAALAESEAGADAIGASEVLDLVEDDALDSADAPAGADPDAEDSASRRRRVLREFRRRALDLAANPATDAKLSLLTTEVRGLLAKGFHPIVFCRFIPTAHYVTEHLRTALGRTVEVEVVTGELASEERAARVAGLAERAGEGRKVLVATDCLSEGVNLQCDFQAVVHYDLAWNPTRHEQREGRVDRFGQPREVVRALMLYGADNGIDGIVLDVLLRKHEAIRRDLGVSVPVPPRSDQVLAALIEGVLLRGKQAEQLSLDLGLDTEAKTLETEWRSTAAAEKASRSRYAQHTISPDKVEEAVAAARRSLGTPDDVPAFARAALAEVGAIVAGTAGGGFSADVSPAPVGVRDALGRPTTPLTFRPDLPVGRGEAALIRTDPRVGALARYVLDAALDPALPPKARPARRCGVIRTRSVATPTTALLVRLRTHLSLPGREAVRVHVAEEARVLAFTGTPTEPVWLTPEATDALLTAKPDANVPPDQATSLMGKILAGLPTVTPHLEDAARAVADDLRDAHVSVRTAARGSGRAGGLGVRGLEVSPQLPVDVLGVYVYLPVAAGGVR